MCANDEVEGLLKNLIELRQFNPCVVVLQNPVVGEPGAGQAISPYLTETHAVPPAAPREGKAYQAARLIITAVYDEELFAQAQRRAYAASAHVRRPTRAYKRRSVSAPTPRVQRERRACASPRESSAVQLVKGEKRSAAAPSAAGRTSM
jgi:hypothetical protein